MNSGFLKTEALAWLRFGKKLEYVCTEGGAFNADVLGLNEKFSVEIEVKVSLADLKREFTSKGGKHHLYASDDAGAHWATPNYFYFFVPAEIEQKTLDLVVEKCPKAGVAVYDEVALGRYRLGDRTRVARKATRLHQDVPRPALRRAVLMRMGSELVGRHATWNSFCDEMRGEVDKANTTLMDSIKQMYATPDHETVEHLRKMEEVIDGDK